MKIRWRFPDQPYCYKTFYMDDWECDDEPPKPGFHRANL